MTAITSKPPDSEKKREKEKKEKNIAPTKIVVRRLPPSMTEEEFLDQVSPIPDHDYIRFSCS
jgi:regulator of nonsense transcripts 3